MKTIIGITKKSYTIEEIASQIGGEIWICGSIYRIRRMSGFAFVIIRRSRDFIQCVYQSDTADFSLDELAEESCVRLKAFLRREARSKRGWELLLLKAEVLSRPKEPSPVVINHKEVNVSMEKLLDYRPVTLRNERERAVFRIEEGISNGFRRFFIKQGFKEIHTPKIVSAGAEGGANLFSFDYFVKKAYLAQSPQFYKQMMVGVFERVFEIGPVFRAEKHDTSRHLNEYTSVDLEMGYIENFDEIMQVETAMILSALEFLQNQYQEEIELLQVQIPDVKEIPVIRFREAKEQIAQNFCRIITDWNDFDPEEEKLLSKWIWRETGSEFVFVTHYPSAKRPFYAMDDPKEPEETLSFDLIFRGLEVTTGGQRIHDFEMQKEKLKKRGLQLSDFESYLMMHRYGMPPHGGLGLGLERFVSRLLNQDNIRYSALFPRDTHRLTP